MEKLRVDLDPVEFEALARLAERDLRPVPCEARHLVREALRHAGLLRSTDECEAPQGEELGP
jgi:hypothetical protein